MSRRITAFRAAIAAAALACAAVAPGATAQDVDWAEVERHVSEMNAQLPKVLGPGVTAEPVRLDREARTLTMVYRVDNPSVDASDIQTTAKVAPGSCERSRPLTDAVDMLAEIRLADGDVVTRAIPDPCE